jgi:hypothetical protein
MSDKIILILIGLAVGFGSFAATGAATAFLIAEVRGHSVPHPKQAAIGYAHLRDNADRIAR